uniref:Uncharacterized protein n=1 Tax=Arundo donax TaxID=35708 RepID=A0A0A9AJ17_ARUDO
MHNVIDETLALRLELLVRHIQITITVGSGNHIISRGLCHNLPLLIEREVFALDAYTFPLPDDTDIILGTPWMCGLGPIL